MVTTWTCTLCGDDGDTWMCDDMTCSCDCEMQENDVDPILSMHMETFALCNGTLQRVARILRKCALRLETSALPNHLKEPD